MNNGKEEGNYTTAVMLLSDFMLDNVTLSFNFDLLGDFMPSNEMAQF